ncbi:hypothetical protein DICVIV_08776 [Dictyocaulus viviparus]|uniref:ShTK domain protein n=1 Tax=Dictyocaulus viviparus TaxID=29172 RepID=A0A0D8XS61_DICVI|nr:hypothetical protein DICVIV_08776 [Dictyocaulus viviparus]
MRGGRRIVVDALYQSTTFSIVRNRLKYGTKRMLLIAAFLNLLLIPGSIPAIVDRNCTMNNAEGNLKFASDAVNCPNVLSDSTCNTLYPQAVDLNADRDRHNNCWMKNGAVDPELVETAVNTCPRTCGYCCITPAYNCQNKQLHIKISKFLLTFGGCSDAIAGCSRVPGICQTIGLIEFAKLVAKNLKNLNVLTFCLRSTVRKHADSVKLVRRFPLHRVRLYADHIRGNLLTYHYLSVFYEDVTSGNGTVSVQVPFIPPLKNYSIVANHVGFAEMRQNEPTSSIYLITIISTYNSYQIIIAIDFVCQ